MGKGVGGSLKNQPSSSWGLLFVPLGLIGIASLIALAALQGCFAGAASGIALVGLTSFVTIRLVRHYPEPGSRSATVVPPLVATPGWLKLLNTGVEVWLDITHQTYPPFALPDASTLTASQQAIAILNAVPGMTTAHDRYFNKSRPYARLQDGTVVKRWKNAVGVEHVFLSDDNDRMLYGGFVGWIHSQGLQQTITQIKRELT